MEYVGDGYKLSTGKRFYANCGILGMDAECSGPSEGYDGGIIEEFTPKEKKEIAEYMVAKWMEWSKQ